jgi:hypothetical protein
MEPHESGNSGTVVDEKTFAFVTELEIRKAVRLQYYVSLLAIDLTATESERIDDLRSVGEQVAAVISEQLRETDLIGLAPTSPALHLLLVNAHLDSLPLVVQRITEEVSRHVFQVDGHARTIQLTVGGSCFPTTASTREELVNQAGSVVARERDSRSRENAPDPSEP